MRLADRELLERISRGDGEAFDAFFTAHRQQVTRHLHRMLRNADTVEDLLQEVFLRVWMRADQWDGRGACIAWLLRIATNQALNYLRTQKRRRELPLEPPHPDREDDDSLPAWLADQASRGPEALYELAERSSILAALIADLPNEKREVIRLVHEAEMEITAVAEQLGIPEGTVKSRLHYARKTLARQWHEQEEE